MIRRRLSRQLAIRIFSGGVVGLLVFLALQPVPAQACTALLWTGKSGTTGPFLWSNAKNWTAALNQGDYLIFPEVVNKHATNDKSPGYSVGSITFDHSTGYLVDGNAIVITGQALCGYTLGLSSTAGSGLNTMDMNIQFSGADQRIDIPDAQSTISILKDIQSSVNLVKTGQGTLILDGANNQLSQALTVAAGTLGFNRITARSLAMGTAGPAILLATINSSSDYSQFAISEAVNLVNVSLTLSASALIPEGQVLTLMHIAGSLTGTFQGLPEGALIKASNGQRFKISYRGGAGGKDVTLTPVWEKSYLPLVSRDS